MSKVAIRKEALEDAKAIRESLDEWISKMRCTILRVMEDQHEKEATEELAFEAHEEAHAKNVRDAFAAGKAEAEQDPLRNDEVLALMASIAGMSDYGGIHDVADGVRKAIDAAFERGKHKGHLGSASERDLSGLSESREWFEMLVDVDSALGIRSPVEVEIARQDQRLAAVTHFMEASRAMTKELKGALSGFQTMTREFSENQVRGVATLHIASIQGILNEWGES